MRAWERHEAGWTQKDVAAALGVTQGAVSHWLKKAREQGEETLRHHPAPGATATVTTEQQAHVPVERPKGANAFGCRGHVWTTARVAQMILHVCGVRSHPAHGRRLLRAIQDSQHQPIHTATQRDDAAIQRWKEHRWEARKNRLQPMSTPSSSEISPRFPCCQWQFARLHHGDRHPLCASHGVVTIVRLWAASLQRGGSFCRPTTIHPTARMWFAVCRCSHARFPATCW